jgi:ADP-ribosyl-[dinitrogen reductase] hydrolase
VKNPNIHMLVRIAQGDAYGMAVEYIKPEHEHIRTMALRFERYGRHPVHKLRAGQYTDDTQMSIGVAEVLLGKTRTREDFAEAFVRCFKRDVRDGYARHFQAFLETVKDGADFLSRIHPDSDKNGAAMRAVPIGVLWKPEQVIETATVQAKLTHDTEGGVGAAVIVAMLSHYALHESAPFANFPEWLKAYTSVGVEEWDGSAVTGPDVGMRTARAVWTLCKREGSLIDIARTAITWGGDVDSVLAIAWGIASTRMREPPLPAFFDDGLEAGSYGRRFLLELGTKLMVAYSGRSR